MTKPMEYNDARSRPFLLGLALMLVVLIGFIDSLLGKEIAFSIAYLIPISLISWYLGKRAGILIAVASSVVEFIANIASIHSYQWPFIYYWNTFVRLGIFLIVAYLLSTLKITLDQLKGALERETDLARRDSLTEVANERAFYEAINVEINMARRYARPFTVAYIDIDNFKMVNHSFGLNTGVTLLRLVAEIIKNNIRAYDKVARLGGDEFAIVLPNTNSETAQVAIPKVRTALIDAARKNNWPITFSVGVVTYTSAPDKIDEVVREANAIMSKVKSDGKNMIKYGMSSGLTPMP